MTQHYFSQKLSNPLEQPLKELMELNMRALQSFSYISPIDLFNVSKPEELLEKNMELLIQNGHRSLDYMQNMFSIMERNWLNLSENLSTSTQEMIKQMPLAVGKNLKKASDMGERTAKKAASIVNKATKRTLIKAETAARKNSKEVVKTMKQATKAASSIVKDAKKTSTIKSNTRKSKVDAGNSSIKRATKGASVMVGKPDTLSKIEAKIHDTRQVSPYSIPSVSKNLDPKDKKDKPLM